LAISPRAKTLLVFAIKVSVAGVLVGWLVRSGALDFRALDVLVRMPWLIALDLAIFFVMSLLGALRYRVLLRLIGVDARYLFLVQLHFVGLFFNVVIPGNVGGDVVKALYVARDAPSEKTTTILLLAFVERFLGLGGLVIMATIVTALRGPSVWNDPQIAPLAATVALLGLGAVLGPIVFVILVRRGGPRLEAWTTGPSRIAKILGKLAEAARLLASGPRYLAAAVMISMAVHALAMTLFTVFARTVTTQAVSLAQVASMYPLGILTILLPISPAGLGVGHLAFDRLFATVGLRDGANVFNVYLVGQLAPCLLGVFPYLLLKRAQGIPSPKS
jgi:glycosyltransferase 2 family protein